MDRSGNVFQMRSLGENACFAASNSSHGFQSYYSDFFDRESIGRVYAIKGGPGTGKSRFMREVAQSGAARGWTAEMIYCSSDADSLDGVILTKNGVSLALLDATAPHVYEPTRPGFREEIVNLGEFWDAEALRRQREEIEALNEQKGNAYKRAYRYLSAYGDVSENRRALVAPYLKEKAIDRFAERLLQNSPTGEGCQFSTALMHSVGLQGAVGFDTYFAQAKTILLIEDCRGGGERMMQALYRAAAQKGLRVRVSRDPILSDSVDGLFLCESRWMISTCPSELCRFPHRTVSTRRFVDTGRMRSVRASVNFTERMRSALLSEAMLEMENVKRHHFRLEEIYAASMDFEAKERFTKSFCNSLFGLQNE